MSVRRENDDGSPLYLKRSGDRFHFGGWIALVAVDRMRSDRHFRVCEKFGILSFDKFIERILCRSSSRFPNCATIRTS